MAPLWSVNQMTRSIMLSTQQSPFRSFKSRSNDDKINANSFSFRGNGNSEEVLEQIYKTIRRIRSEQKRTSTVYEDNLKKVEDRIAQLEKNITNQFKQQQMREQLNKREENNNKVVKEPKGLLGKVLANQQQIQFGVVLFLVFWIWLSMRSMSAQISSMSLAK